MRIRRSRPTADFVQVPNATVRDDRLGHMARGILVEILSRPDGWETTADDMWRESAAKHGTQGPGRRAFRAAFAELKSCGYLTAARELLQGGRHATILTVTDVPHAGTSERPAETGKGAGRTGVPHAGTPESPTDVPHGGTSESPGQMSLLAGGTDVPLSDVPHAGTSSIKRAKNTGTKTGKPDAPGPAADVDAIPEAARPLVDGLSLSGVTVRWPFRGTQWMPVLALITSRGVPALIECARKVAARADVESARYFLPAWGELPPMPAADAERPPLRAVPGGYQPYKALPASAYENDQGF